MSELYVHIPFCIKKCNYCAFCSYPAKQEQMQDYIDLLLSEADIRKKQIPSALHTVFIGGGTPSILPEDLFRRLILGLQKSFSFDQIQEITTEANPGTVNESWMKQAAALGINRVSIGMQAFQPELLHLLGRIHSFENVIHAVSLTRKSGISNINLDLIFGIPGQTMEQWKETLLRALDLNPCHLSIYGLIPEENTPLYRDLQSGVLSLPEPELEREMYDTALLITEQSGFHQYEISNFSQPGMECIHNIGYWTQVPYLGIGLAAASMLYPSVTDSGFTYTRYTNPDSADAYKHFVLHGCHDYLEQESITPAMSRFETMMLSLRMNCGISEETFIKMHHMPLEACYGTKLAFFEKNGLMIHDRGRWRLSRKGMDIQNSILVELMDDSR